MLEGQLHVERSGGFGGLTVHASVPLEELSPGERHAVETCFQMESAGPAGPDRFVYRLRVGEREAAVQEDRLPPGLQELLERLADAWSC